MGTEATHWSVEHLRLAALAQNIAQKLRQLYYKKSTKDGKSCCG